MIDISTEALIDYSYYGDAESVALEVYHAGIRASAVAGIKNIIIKMTELCQRFMNKVREILVKESKAPAEALNHYRKLKTAADRLIGKIWIGPQTFTERGAHGGVPLLEELKRVPEYETFINFNASEVPPEKWVKFNTAEVTQPISKCLKLLSREKARLNTLSSIQKVDTPQEDRNVKENQLAANATVQVTKFIIQISQKMLSFRSKDVSKKNLQTASAKSLDDAKESYLPIVEEVEMIAQESTNMSVAYEAFNPINGILNLIDRVIGLFQRLIIQIRKIGVYYIPKKVLDSFMRLYNYMKNNSEKMTLLDVKKLENSKDYELLMEKADVYKKEEFVKFDISNQVLGELQKQIKLLTKYKAKIRNSQLFVRIINAALSYHKPKGEPKYQRLDRPVKGSPQPNKGSDNDE